MTNDNSMTEIMKNNLQINTENLDSLTPSRIVELLDKYIIGQDKAKKAVAIALRNRTRRNTI